MRSIGHFGKGNGAADNNWLLARGPHAPGAYKAGDTLRLKFRNNMRLALYSDGMFRLADSRIPSDVRFVDTDAAAWAKWSGSHSAVEVPAVDTTPVAEVKAPTAPNVQAAANGALTATANCQHCKTKNVVTYAECRACGKSDWQSA
jgi:hypothetical protein